MKNRDKILLHQLIREGLSFKEIRRYMNCSDATVKNYIKAREVKDHD